MVDENSDLFRIVGANYIEQEEVLPKISWKYKLRQKPYFSSSILLIIVLCCIFAPLISNHDPSQYYLDSLNERPNGEFYFGTDSLGRDIFSIMFYGGRTSILIGLLGMAIISFIGIVYGCISGISNSHVDSVMMRATELFSSVPTLLMILILTAVYPARNIVSMSIVIGVTGWYSLARIVRSEVRQIRNCEYILYARASGASFFSVMIRHLIPNFLSAIMFAIVSSIGSCITTESTLSFLGLGLPLDILSWGSMLSLANKALILNTYWVILIPGIFLVTTLLCITGLGNFLRKENNRKPSNL